MITRRQLVSGLVLTGVGGVPGVIARAVAAEPPPEVTTIRLLRSAAICVAPQYVAEDLLRSEGFTEVRYVDAAGALGALPRLAAGEADVSMTFSGPLVVQIDAGDPVVILAGIHAGCFELFGNERVRTIRDLKGKTVAVLALRSSQHIFLSAMASYVGLDPRRDIAWLTRPSAESIQLFADGKIDAYMGFPPEPQELRGRGIGHVVVNSALDRPWSQYFCCMLAGNREFVRKYPIATRRALRAILKAAEVCAAEPERAARLLVQRGHVKRVDYALQALREIPYVRWRDYEPEDTLRFYALRLHEAGMIKSSPQKIIAQGTEWRFLNELKKELKG
jgi:NitT/TauT family transport system substrate-binding protein